MASAQPLPYAKVKHPKELSIIFMTELWERFGYYLMLALFTLYLTSHLKMDDEQASKLYGFFIAGVYFTPFFGGILADKLLGYRRSVIIGAGLLSLGYGWLAFIADRIHAPTYSLYGCLVLITIGNGFFKPNISTLVGNLYPQGDPRRDAGFSIFYMAVNVGGLLSPFVGVWLGNKYGPSAAFGAAAVGMFIGFLTFTFQSHRLKAADQRSSVSAILHVPLPKQYEDHREPPEVERRRIFAIFIMCVVVAFFWMVFHQNGSTLNFFAQKHTDLTFNGLIPAWVFAAKDQDNSYAGAILQAVNPLFVIIFTFPLIALFNFLRARKMEPTTPTKIGIGMLLTAASWVIMVIASIQGGNNGQVSPWWLISTYLVMTLGELNLSPLGTSLVTKLAPRRMTAMMLGVWYLATSLGNYLAGALGKFWKRWPHDKFFLLLVATSLFSALILFLFLPFLNRTLPKQKTP